MDEKMADDTTVSMRRAHKTLAEGNLLATFTNIKNTKLARRKEVQGFLKELRVSGLDMADLDSRFKKRAQMALDLK
jgi:hypothetical protein